jgi:hypothetical protein
MSTVTRRAEVSAVPICGDEYGRVRGERIIRCGRSVGHDGPHWEDESEMRAWVNHEPWCRWVSGFDRCDCRTRVSESG